MDIKKNIKYTGLISGLVIGGYFLMSNEMIKRLKIFISLIGGYILFLIGDIDKFILLLSMMILLDIITGLIKAVFEKNINSKKMFIGGYRKVLIFVLIMIGNTLDNTFNDLFLRQSIILYFIIQEVTSIFENINTYIDLPPKLTEYFEQMQEREGKGNE